MRLEDKIQRGILQLVGLKAHPSLIWFHVPNGNMLTESSRKYFTGLGMVAGVADLVFVLPDLRAAFMEIKTPTGKQSVAQKAFHLRCDAAGVPYEIVRSVDEADAVLSRWGAFKIARREAA